MKRIVPMLLMAFLIVMFAVGVTSAAPEFNFITNDQAYFALGGVMSNLVVKDDVDAKWISFLAATFYELVSERKSWEHGIINAVLFNGGRYLFQVEF